MFYRFLFGCIVLASSISLHAQQVNLNEIMSSNTAIFDEDGDTPDWFEIYNPGPSPVSLNGWTASDRFDNPGKWAFPDMSLVTDSYLLVWASGKDKASAGSPRTLISQGDQWKFILPTQPVDPQWKNPGFDDSSWSTGTSGFGYGDADDATTFPQGTRSVYLRKTFTINDLSAIQELYLHVDYDDAFVAYINGVEVARANIAGTPPAYNDFALTDHEAAIYNGGIPDRFGFTNPGSILQNGENVLCVQAHNVSGSSSDFTIIPFLSVLFNGQSSEGIAPPALLQLNEQHLHTSFKISAAGETVYLFDQNGNLVDSLLAEGIPSDISYGRQFGGSNFVYFAVPTPGEPNGSQGYDGIISESIIFSHQGGNVGASNLELELSGIASPFVIRYTLDATEPDENSALYAAPIHMNSNTVVRAKVFRTGYLSANSQSKTYLFSADHALPVISLVTEPGNFFDTETGIYVLGNDYEFDYPHFGANFWQDWERPIHFSFYENDGTLGTEFNARVKIFGGWSRANDQRSLSLFARKQYGTEEINYPFFPNLPYSDFQALVLRNSGNDWNNTMMRDATLTSLMRGTSLDFQAFRPAVTYLNGEYWGFYNLREKVNEHFLATKHNLDPDDIDLLEANGQTVHGDNLEYQALINYISGNNLTSNASYEFVADQVDIENYIIYQVAQIYFDNTDWPGNNIKFWKHSNGKWRWILYDTDFGFGIWNATNYQNNTLAFALQANGPGWPNPPWSTLLFRRLAQNQQFKKEFVNRFADELNSRFLPARVCEHIDSLSEKIKPEINAHYYRWGGNPLYWENQVNSMKNFASQRPQRVKQHILSTFGLPAYRPLTIQNEDVSKGFVKINNRLTIKETSWSGDYFENVEVKVVAIPEPGYIFSHWSGSSTSSSPELEVNMTIAKTLTPHFTTPSGDEITMIINEINYQSSPTFDTDDWVELYNPAPSSVNLANWQLRDSEDDPIFSFPEGSQLPGFGYMIVTRDIGKFRLLHPNVDNVVGDFDFDLSNSADAVRLFNSNGQLKDSVSYLSAAPWPTQANGTGATLELISTDLDNLLPGNWANVNINGSPGSANIYNPPPFNGENIEDLKYYPNPFAGQVFIDFCVKKETEVNIDLFDIKGAFISTIFSGNLSPGNYHLENDFSFLSKGVYLLEFKEGKDNSTIIKWIKGSE